MLPKPPIRPGDTSSAASADSWLPMTDNANSSCLMIDDANSQVPEIDAQEAGGPSPSVLIEGAGLVVTGAAESVTVNTGPKILSLPDGTLSVLASNTDSGGLHLVLQNETGVALDAIYEHNGETSEATLPSGGGIVSLPFGAAPGQLTVQIRPSGTAFPGMVTVVASVDTARGLPDFVAQAFSGVV
jgi:hypothetical protein